MPDDAFPGVPAGVTVDAIGKHEYSLVFPEDGSPAYARYSVQLLSDGEIVKVKQGFLFKTGGPDHLTGGEKADLQTMDTRLVDKMTTAWVGQTVIPD